MAEMIFIFAGLIAKLIIFVAGIMGIFLIPLLLVAQHPDAPVAAPLHWLLAHFSHDMVFLIYTVIWGIVVGVLVYASIVFDYLQQHRKCLDKTPEAGK